MLNREEKKNLMETVYNDMTELLRTDEGIRERIKTDEVNVSYDLLMSIFFGEDYSCIYNENLSYGEYDRWYSNKVKANIRYYKNKLLGIKKTKAPDNFCIGVVLIGKINWLTYKSFPSIELVPFPERMTYRQALRKIRNELYVHNDEPLIKYVIYRIEENGDYTEMH